MHDIIEDTDISDLYLSTHFGESISQIVKAVSNHKDETKTKLENKRITFSKIAENEQAIIVKLADRIANVEFSLLHGNIKLLDKYKKEQLLIEELFPSVIKSIKAQKLFVHLKELFKIAICLNLKEGRSKKEL